MPSQHAHHSLSYQFDEDLQLSAPFKLSLLKATENELQIFKYKYGETAKADLTRDLASTNLWSHSWVPPEVVAIPQLKLTDAGTWKQHLQ